jgi:hypothetical protein
MKVKIELNFDSLEFLVGVREFLEYPHRSCHCMLVITQVHIVNEVWIEKSISITGVTLNQGFSLSKSNI